MILPAATQSELHQQSAEPAPKRTIWLVLVLLVAIGTLLRYWMLGAKSLWLVEAFSLYVARLSWPAFLRTMWWGEANMTLYYVLLRGWLHVADSEFWLRSLSAVFGIAAIPAVYCFGSRFLTRKAGLMAAAFLAVNSFHVRYSQELRSYSLLALLVILSTCAFLAVFEAPERKSRWLLYVLFSAAAVYAHMFAAFALASQWLVLTPSRIKRLGILRLLLSAAAIAILVAPVAAVVIFEHKEQLDWVPSLSLAGVTEVLQDIAGAGTTLRGQALPSVLLVLFVVAWAVALASLFRSQPAARPEYATRAFALALLSSGLVFPVAAMAALSLLKPILAPRYLIMCIPPASLLAGWGLASLQPLSKRARAISTALFVIMLAVASLNTWAYFASFKTYGHNGRGVARYVLSHAEPGDAIIFYTFSEHHVFEYYLMRQKEAGEVSAEPAMLFPLDLDRATIQKRTQPYGRVWLVLHQTRATPLTDSQTELIRAALLSHFHLATELNFPGQGVDRGESGAMSLALYTHLASGSD